METYKVIIEQTAENDLFELLDYIGLTLHEPRSAERIYYSIKEQILSLSDLPFRNPLVQEEPYRTAGVRRILVENYAAFYLVDEKGKEVHVFRILYNRREWKSLL